MSRRPAEAIVRSDLGVQPEKEADPQRVAAVRDFKAKLDKAAEDANQAASLRTIAVMWSAGYDKDTVDIVAADPSLLASIRAEITRIETPAPAGRRRLLDVDRPDEVSKRIHAALSAIVAACEAKG